MKEKIRNIFSITLAALCITSITVNAATLINSKEVVYDNAKSGLRSKTVQGAVDELYSAATDYSSLETRVTALESSSFLNAHPVGSIYVTVSEEENTIEKMHNLYGGTWESYGQGRTLIAAGTITDSSGNVQTYNVGDTGGNNSIKLVSSQIPNLNVTGTTDSYGSGYTFGYTSSSKTTGSAGSHSHTLSKSVMTDINSTDAITNGLALQDYSAGQWKSLPKSLTTNTVNDHSHSFTDKYANSLTGVEAHTHTFTGTYKNTSQDSINIQNPYIIVYMYKRVN